MRPDHVIEVKRRLLEEIDGPMLPHGPQGFDGQTITMSTLPVRIGALVGPRLCSSV